MELQERPFTPTGPLLQDKSRPTTGVAGIKDSSDAGSPQAPTGWQNISQAVWLWESFSAVAIVGALAALAAVLVDAEGQTLRVWRDAHHGVSLNAVIAVITTLLKGTSMLILAQGKFNRDFHAQVWFLLSIPSDRPDQVALV